jgi:glutaconate CoA-transferase, subunit A
VNKTMTMREAVATYVEDGSSLYISGFTHLIGFAAAREIIRQGRTGLRLIRMTPDVVYDLMVAAGAASEVTFGYLGNPGLGSLQAIRRAIEGDEITYVEYSHGSLIAALRAGGSDLPFAPVPALVGTDLVSANPRVSTVVSPFGGEEVPLVPPLRPDVAIVHVHRSDTQGNAQAWGGLGDLKEAGYAARKVVVTAEEIVSEDVIRSDPGRTVLPGFVVDAVVHAPFGAHPSFAQGLYGRDNRYYRHWAEASRSTEQISEHLREEVHDLADHAAYVDRYRTRLEELRGVGSAPSEPVEYGSNLETARVQE